MKTCSRSQVNTWTCPAGLAGTDGLGFLLIYMWFVSSGGAAAGGNQRRQRLAQDFLAWMDQTGELLSLAERQEVDPVKQERMEVRGRLLHVKVNWRYG